MLCHNCHNNFAAAMSGHSKFISAWFDHLPTTSVSEHSDFKSNRYKNVRIRQQQGYIGRSIDAMSASIMTFLLLTCIYDYITSLWHIHTTIQLTCESFVAEVRGLRLLFRFTHKVIQNTIKCMVMMYTATQVCDISTALDRFEYDNITSINIVLVIYQQLSNVSTVII